MNRKLTYFVSDVHLGLQVADPEDRERRFVEFLHSLPENTDALYLLGDIWDFWYEYKHVVPKVAPPVDGSFATTDAISEIYTFDGGDTVDLSRYEGTFQQRKSVDTHIRSLKEEKDRLENQIKVLMGNSPKATCGLFTVSWKNQKTSGLDREAIKRDYPDIDFSKYATESRVFRITEKKSKKGD